MKKFDAPEVKLFPLVIRDEVTLSLTQEGSDVLPEDTFPNEE